MLRSRPILSLLILLACLGAAAQTDPNSKVASFFISAFDGHGNPVSLEKESIEVKIDRSLAVVSNLHDASTEPLDFVVAVDLSNSGGSRAELIKQLTVNLFQVLSTGQNQGLLVLLQTKPEVSNRPLQPEEVKQVMQKVGFGGGTSFYDAVRLGSEAASRLPNYKDHRHAMIVISDGEDNQSAVNVETAIHSAIGTGLPVYGIYVSEKMNSPRGHDRLEKVSKQTGGFFFDSLKPLDAIPKVAELIAHQYLATITSAALANSDRHELRVATSVKHVQIAAPQLLLLH